MSAWRRKVAVCNSKTSVGNCYATEGLASRAAVEMRVKLKEFIRAYKCKVCDFWHVGRAYRVECWKKKLNL